MFAYDDRAQREAVRQLVDLVADLAFENVTLRTLYERELVSRLHGDRTIARLQEVLYRRAG
jgi:hypothetical protein